MKYIFFLIAIAFFPIQTMAGEESHSSSSSHLNGRILLQVEENGEAWYVQPDTGKRYFMGRPADAFNLMRSLGLGIAHDELSSYLNGTFPDRLLGMILLDVEKNGEAYYVYPVDKKAYFLGRPAEAFDVMRNTGLGISNTNLKKISVSSDSTTPPKGMSSTAKYKFEFVATWSAQTHPNHYPSNAHFSPFVVHAHDNSGLGQGFVSGQLASDGIELMAETGQTSILTSELNTLKESGHVYKYAKGSVFDAPGSVYQKLYLHKDFSHFTFVSMLAPSPDWFVAAKGNLIEDGEWVERLEMGLRTYDAGTDSGEELTSADVDTSPAEVITTFPDHLQNLGTLIITRVQ